MLSITSLVLSACLFSLLTLLSGCGGESNLGVDVSSPTSTIKSLDTALKSGDASQYSMCFISDHRRTVDLSALVKDLNGGAVTVEFLRGREKKVKDTENHRDRVDKAWYVCELTYQGRHVRIPFTIVFQEGQYLIDRPVLFFYDKDAFFPPASK